MCFFFQAEDGIRDIGVTGVQTCALPIYIGNYRYTVLAATGNNNNYILGRDDHSQTGSKASGLPNPSLKWEESIQTDLGLELGFLNNALTEIGRASCRERV